MARLHPTDNGVIKILCMVKVTENRMFGAFPHGIHNEIRDPQVHIGNPHREHIFTIEELARLVVLEATRSFSVNYFVKIVVHGLLEISRKSTNN